MKDFSQKKRSEPLSGKLILINAGPTHEHIDPVRFISNYSTGKMGVALADAASDYGAEVVLVTGPVSIIPSRTSVRIINVISAAEMARECTGIFPECDIAILTAAVADYTPVTVSEQKIKGGRRDLVIRLTPTTDIAVELGRMKTDSQLVIGFALETDNEIENALAKLKRKNLDIIVLNSLKDEGAGFGYDTNRVTIIDRNNNIDKFELKSKSDVARDILDKIISLIS